MTVTLDELLTRLEAVKKVPLTKGQTALVDAGDWDRVVQHSWCACPMARGRYRAQSRIAGKAIYLHRFILDAPAGIEIDHENDDPLDNRRCNIRLASHAGNARNRVPPHGVSKFKGLRFRSDLTSRPWRAQISFDGHCLYLGYFATEEEAARAYNHAAIILFGEFARLNEVAP
jgi:hypothetical protein